MPEKFQFGEATLTEAEFNKLLGAFIIATPIVSEFNSRYNYDKSQWETDIKTNVTFIDVGAGGIDHGHRRGQISGSDKSNQNKSISNAIEGIPMQLQFEIRKIAGLPDQHPRPRGLRERDQAPARPEHGHQEGRRILDHRRRDRRGLQERIRKQGSCRSRT